MLLFQDSFQHPSSFSLITIVGPPSQKCDSTFGYSVLLPFCWKQLILDKSFALNPIGMSPRCENVPDCFSYVYGRIIHISYSKISCISCAWSVRGWLQKTHLSLPFAIPIIRRKPKNRAIDFRINVIRGFPILKTKRKVV